LVMFGVGFFLSLVFFVADHRPLYIARLRFITPTGNEEHF